MSQEKAAVSPSPAAATAAAVPQDTPPHHSSDATQLNEKAEHPVANNTAPLTGVRSISSSNAENEKRSGNSSSSGLVEDPADRMVIASSTDTTPTLTDDKPKKKGLFKKKEKPVDKDMGEVVKPVSIPTMFRYAKPWELAANLFGIFLACAAGATQPLMTLIFGRLTTSFTQFGMIVNQIAQEGPTPENTARLDKARGELKHDSGLNALYLMAIGIGMVSGL